MNSRALLVVLLAVCAVGGCSRHPANTSASARLPHLASAYVAVARGRVDVPGGTLPVSSPVAGTLASVNVHEGDQVKRGQVLATLDTAPATTTLDMAKAHLQQAQAQQQLLEVQWKAAKIQATRLRAAAKADAGSNTSADVAATDVGKLAAERAAAGAAAAAARSSVDAARYALQHDTLRAPADADVVEVHAQVGASVPAQSAPLFVLLPQGKRIIRAELSTVYADAVHVGMHAKVSTDDDPTAVATTAHVFNVGHVVGPSTLEDDPQLRATTRTVQCLLAIDQPAKLRVGQRVLVRFLPGRDQGQHQTP